jgi:1-acyl-sn-glycerol-3-phosphate acyltransferase
MDRQSLLSRLSADAADRFIVRGCALRVVHAVALPTVPFLVCANHRSHADSVAIIAALGIPFRSCALLAAQDYFFAPAPHVKLASAIFNLIPLDRTPSPSSFKAMLDACRSFMAAGGRSLIAFPEGTRATSDRIAPFKRGPAVVALSLGLPILPAFVGGTQHVLPKGSFVPRRAPITVSFGTPIGVQNVSGVKSMRRRSTDLAVEIELQVRTLSMADYDGR